MDSSTERSPEYIPTLDGWRAIAILWVMLLHSKEELFPDGGNLFFRAMRPIALSGTAGVDIFFGLSGFLISSKMIAERSRSGKFDIGRFYIKRCFRILPPYLCYLLVIGLLWFGGIFRIDWRTYLSCFVFLRNYLPDTLLAEWYTGHLWSLSVEEHFYLIWPWLFAAGATLQRTRRVVLMLGLVMIIWRYVDLTVHPLHFLRFYINESGRRSDHCLGGLFLGCWLALLFAEPGMRCQMARLLSPTIFAALGVAFLGGAVFLTPVQARLESALFVPFLLSGTVLHPQWFVSRLLELPPVRWVGRLSYSLYIWQQLFLVDDSKSKLFPSLQRFPVSWIGAFVVASASFGLIEKPAIALGQRILARRSPGLASPPEY